MKTMKIATIAMIVSCLLLVSLILSACGTTYSNGGSNSYPYYPTSHHVVHKTIVHTTIIHRTIIHTHHVSCKRCN